jgi:cytochrome P450
MALSVGGLARAGLNSLPRVNLSPPAGELPGASAAENARFNALVVVPNALQGIFRRRRRAVAVATRADVDRWAVGLLEGMRRTYGGKPVWVRLVTDPALLLFSVEDIRAALEGSPEPFAPDPEAKRKGMSHFQPDALTISRGEDWAERRRFAESVLDTGQPLHRLADGFASVVADEAKTLLLEVEAAGGELEWERFALTMRRIVRRIVLGDSARDDEALTDLLFEMMDGANSMPDEPSPKLDAYLDRLGDYVTAAEGGSLVGLLDEAPQGDRTKPVRQVTHWLFAMGDTVAINAFRALAAIDSHPQAAGLVEAELSAAKGLDGTGVRHLAYLRACLEETMRLWPTTPMLSRVTLAETELGDVKVPAGTQILFVNTYMHRDRDRLPHADTFVPEAWLEGGAAGDDWSFNHFSHGTQGCPGAGLALFVGTALLAQILTQRQVTMPNGKLDPERSLPHMLDFFPLRFRLAPRA